MDERAELLASKEKFRQSMELASPARIVRERPFEAMAIALFAGVALGFSDAPRKSAAAFTDMALFASGRLAVRAVDALINNPGEKRSDIEP